MEETADFDTTPVQFALLNALKVESGEDQITLSNRVTFDPATLGSVIARLEAKGWVRRQPNTGDKRCKLLWITAEGEKRLAQMTPAVMRAQHRIFDPLDTDERLQLQALLQKMVFGHEAAVRQETKSGSPGLPSDQKRDV
ncbi:MAG: MarR family transcriptional regulator [Polaromonas sp.]